MRDAIRRLLRKIGRWLAIPGPLSPANYGYESSDYAVFERIGDELLAGPAVGRGKAA